MRLTILQLMNYVSLRRVGRHIAFALVVCPSVYINQFIVISENYCTRDQAGTKTMSVGFLCYFNKMSFYYILEKNEINDPSINELCLPP